MTTPARRRVLVTGGSGRIGGLVAANLQDRCRLTLLDRQPQPKQEFPLILADISQGNAIAEHFHGIDTVIHLAADPLPTAPWVSLFPNNIVGTFNVVQAACAAGCRRIVFASSLHAVLGYPPAKFIHSGLPPCPDSLYGASKAWGEALARVYATASTTSILCVRIGFLATPGGTQLTPGHPRLRCVITEHDLIALLAACIDAPDIVRFGIFHGVSDRHSTRFDMEAASRVLGFIPQDNSHTLAWRNVRGMTRRLRHALYRRWQQRRR